MTIREHCDYLGWTVSELSRQARISYNTAKKAYHNEPVTSRVVVEIASAFSSALNRRINVGDLTGVVMQ